MDMNYMEQCEFFDGQSYVSPMLSEGNSCFSDQGLKYHSDQHIIEDLRVNNLPQRNPLFGAKSEFQCPHPQQSQVSKSEAQCPSETDPFSSQCRIPVPTSPLTGYHMWLETSFMYRRNERERQRVRNVNDGFSRLSSHLPKKGHKSRRESKVEILRNAISYIRQLQRALDKEQMDSKENAK